MKNLLKAILSLFASLALLAGCGDDPKPNNYSKKLSDGNGNWILTARTYSVGGVEEDEYAQYPTCLRDDITHFSINGVYQMLNGPSKCDENDPDILEEGTWDISSKQLVILLAGEDVPDVFDILQLNTTTLKLKWEEVDSGVTHSSTSTYTKQ